MTDEYSEFFTDLNSVDTAFDGFTELGRHGHSLLGRIVRHGQIWFVKSYILRDAAEAELRIRKEYELLLKLNHPGVVRAGWLFRMTDAGLCLAMEYLDGERLDMFLKHASKIERKRISDSLLQTMAYVHARNICHLDLKPANILVTGHGNLTAIKIIDFGMADSPGSALFKNPGGSRAYGAPEQFEEGYTSTTRSDVYSLGKLLLLVDAGAAYCHAAELSVKDCQTKRPIDAQAVIDIIRATKRRRSLVTASLITGAVAALIISLSAWLAAKFPSDPSAAVGEHEATISAADSTSVAMPEKPEVKQEELAATVPVRPQSGNDKNSPTPDDEYDRLVRQWQKEIDRRISEMETMAQRNDLTEERRREAVQQMNDALIEDTKKYFQPFYKRVGEAVTKSKPMSWCSIYDPAFQTRRDRISAIYRSI